MCKGDEVMNNEDTRRLSMSPNELIEWRAAFAKVDGTPKMKEMAVGFRDAMNLKGWQIYELLRGEDAGTVLALMAMTAEKGDEE